MPEHLPSRLVKLYGVFSWYRFDEVSGDERDKLHLTGRKKEPREAQRHGEEEPLVCIRVRLYKHPSDRRAPEAERVGSV